MEAELGRAGYKFAASTGDKPFWLEAANTAAHGTEGCMPACHKLLLVRHIQSLHESWQKGQAMAAFKAVFDYKSWSFLDMIEHNSSQY